jgi:hypothetical protein
MDESEVDVVVVGGPKGLKLSHEASVIATTERAEMKMIDSFIARNVDGAGYLITTRREPQSVQDSLMRAGAC